MNQDEAALRANLCRWAKSMFERGLTGGSSGNISVRTATGFLATPTNSCLGFLDPAALSELDATGAHLGGPRPTKEVPLHMAMYAARPEAGAVVHLHSTYATLLACLADTDPADAIPPLTPYVVMRVGRVPVLPYVAPGDPAIAALVRERAADCAALLLGNHGPVVAGETLDAAVYAAEELEETAKLAVLARQLRPRLLDPAAIARLRAGQARLKPAAPERRDPGWTSPGPARQDVGAMSLDTNARQADCDLLVIGSGAAGLSAAVTAAWHGLRVIVAEKEPVFGGTTAWSGGWMWTPQEPAGATRRDRRGDRGAAPLPARGARQQLRRPEGGGLPAGGAADGGVLRGETALQFEAGNHIFDTYGNLPGAGTGGRSVIAAPYDAREARPPRRAAAPADARDDVPGNDHPGGAGPQGLHERDPLAARLPLRVAAGHAAPGRPRAAPARDAAAQRHRAGRPAAALGGRSRRRSQDHVAGDAADRGGRRRAGRRARDARGRDRGPGAAGAWCWPRAAFRTTPSAGAPCSRRPGSTGPSPRRRPPATACGSAKSVGGSVDDTLAAPGAWCPVSLVPFADGTTGRFPHIIERGKPGIIGVLADGRRFCNEGDGYYDYVAAMLRAVPPGDEVASWLVCSRSFQRRYGLGISRPAPLPVGPWIRSGYIRTGRTVAELARACGIDPEGLERTLEDYNRHARRGEDPAFDRGSTPYNRLQGDPANRPNPCVAPIERGPFYAVKVVPGSFGTFAGLRTDASARVLDAAGQPIPGLYAAGTDMASVMGGHYPAGGINLGPAMTFGYIAGRHAAGAGDWETGDAPAGEDAE